MDSDSAIVVYTTGSDAGTTDQPNRILNDNTAGANNERPSAIERQRAALQAGATRNRADQNTQPSTSSSRLVTYFYDLYHSDSGRFGRQVSLWVLLIAAGVLSIISIFHAVKNETAPQAALAKITKPLQKSLATGASSEKDAVDSITVPISDVGLRAQPELLQQVVAVYRLRLATDPNNSVATAALSRIREHSLAELAAISTTESAPRATDSLRLVVKLFPELAQEPRYRSIAARINTNANTMARSQLPAVAEPTVATQQLTPAAKPAPNVAPQQPTPAVTAAPTIAAQQPKLATTPTPTIVAQQPKPATTPTPTVATQQPQPVTTPTPAVAAQQSKPATSPTPTVATATQQSRPATTSALITQLFQPLTPAPQAAQPPTPASNSTTQSPVAVATRKPQVRVMSLTSGIIQKDRFIPTKGGNVFRLNIGYRHRDNPLVNQPGAGLVAQLSESGSSKSLGEVPVEIDSSSGEKSLLIGTFAKGKSDKFYTLNFVIDGYELPSHRVQLTQP